MTVAEMTKEELFEAVNAKYSKLQKEIAEKETYPDWVKKFLTAIVNHLKSRDMLLTFKVVKKFSEEE